MSDDAKRDIVIRRPDGAIPGLRAVNDQLEKVGALLVISAATPKDGPLIWEDCFLQPLDSADPSKFLAP
jgi:hypothetical protein